MTYKNKLKRSNLNLQIKSKLFFPDIKSIYDNLSYKNEKNGIQTIRLLKYNPYI